MPPKCVRVESASAGGGDKACVDVYFRLKGVEHDMWELGSPTGEPFDRWVHKFPFGIGRTRTADESIGLGDGEDSWLTVTSGKVSRRHAVIFYDEDTQQFKIRCHSDNGVDVNQRHIEKDEVAPLPSKSTVRIGPIYFFFLLPRAVLPPHAAGGGGGGGGASKEAAAAAAAAKKKQGATVPYATVVDHVYEKYFLRWAYFCVADMVRLALVEYPAHNLPEDPEKLKTPITQAITKSSEYDFVAAPPADMLKEYEATHAGSAAQKAARWVKRLDPAAAAAKKQKQLATAAAAASAKRVLEVE